MNFKDSVNQILKRGRDQGMTDKEFLEAEINDWLASSARQSQITGERYYVGEHDILERRRQAIGEDGELTDIDNLPNNRIVDNQYGLCVDQKTHYLVGRPITINTENEKYLKALKTVFNKAFDRKLKAICTECINGGIAYLYPHYEDDELKFRIFPSYEILPFWRDREHTDLESFVRVYQVEAYEGKNRVIIDKVEYYTLDGVKYYVLENGRLYNDVDCKNAAYIEVETRGEVEKFNWERIPLIAFKFNAMETPLIDKVKSLQDGINTIMSDFMNNMQEDCRNTILVLVNYDGENLGEFRHNLAKYGAVKVESRGEGQGGDLKTLQVEVNSDNYEAILKLFKKALIENARGFDSKDERLNGTPNQMNIQSMYSDIDLDAHGMETEFQAAFEELLWFVDTYLVNMGLGDFEGEEVEVVFNRDVLVNTSTLIDDINKSVGLVSNETLLAKHPFVSDVEEEFARLEEEGASKNAGAGSAEAKPDGEDTDGKSEKEVVAKLVDKEATKKLDDEEEV